MPFVLLIVGVILLIAGIRGQIGTLASLVKSDFTGSGNYLYWVVAILVIGSIGYVKKMQAISDSFLALVLIALLISNKGFFTQFMSGLSATTNCPASQSTSTSPGSGAAPQFNFNAPLFSPSQNIPNLSNYGEGLLQMQSLGM